MKRLRHVLVTVCLTTGLIACGNQSDGNEEQSSPRSLSALQVLSDSSIEEELSYIEALIGVEELSAAKMALETLESEMSSPVNNDDLFQRLTVLKETLSEVEISEEDNHDHAFTGVDAVAIAIDRYGADDDIVYMYDENHEHYGENQIGYYVALKSKSLQEQEGGDGIVLMLFVGDDGSIAEL